MDVSIGNDGTYERLAGLVSSQFGIQLDPSKQDLVLGRLRRIMRDRGYATLDDYVAAELASPSPGALSDLIDRISTNHTYFWRESGHFTLFTELLRELISQREATGQRDVRVWCAACSSGEEPYTLAMLLLEALGPRRARWQAGVLATDISSRVLEVARAGIYGVENVARLPDAMARRWFNRRSGDVVEVAAELREEVMFRRLNLMNERFPFKAPFDFIFIRNVMIYFDADTRAALIARLRRHLNIGGYLVVGHSESLPQGADGMVSVRPSVYRRVT
ncbi:MAG: chemotaxis protein CheR [Proteobacteria bacterium]|nr:MAG: chemotaxis protein CheR [Pseudomonadota bacterium]